MNTATQQEMRTLIKIGCKFKKSGQNSNILKRSFLGTVSTDISILNSKFLFSKDSKCFDSKGNFSLTSVAEMLSQIR
jgi:hypothetical protein